MPSSDDKYLLPSAQESDKWLEREKHQELLTNSLPRRRVILSPETFLAMMQAYSEDCQDRVPINAKIINVGVVTALPRMVGFMVEADGWEGGSLLGRAGKIGIRSPLHFRFEGNKMLNWGDREQPAQWDYVEKGIGNALK